MKTSGGMQVAEGSYGCFFQPQLACKLSQQRPTTGGSKLMFEEEEVLKELASSKSVLKWDPKSLQSSVPQTYCEVSLEVVRAQEDLDKCTLDQARDTNRKVFLLQTSDGSEPGEYVDLSMLRGPFLKGPQALARGLANLFRGLDVFHSKNFFHNDIHGSNAIVSRISGNMKWIDFGLSLQIQNWPEFPPKERDVIQQLQKNYTSRRVPLGLALFWKWILHREEIRKMPNVETFMRWSTPFVKQFPVDAWKASSQEDFDFSLKAWAFFMGRNAYHFQTTLKANKDAEMVYAFRQQDLSGAFTTITDLLNKNVLDGASLKLRTTLHQIQNEMVNYLMKGDALTNGLQNLPWTLWASMLE